MKLLLHCNQCELQNTGSDNPDHEFMTVELNNDNQYSFKCSKGHSNTFILQNEKFDLLFTSGMIAFLEGYYYESVLSFSAALERFYEYYIRTIALFHKIDIKVIEKFWKQLPYTERQLGAFLSCYLIENKKPFSTELDKLSKFRNDVVHKGKFPKREEVFKHAKKIYEIITDVIKELKELEDKLGSEVTKLNNRELRKKIQDHSEMIPNDNLESIMCIDTFIGTNFTTKIFRFEDKFEDFKKNSLDYFTNIEHHHKKSIDEENQ